MVVTFVEVLTAMKAAERAPWHESGVIVGIG
jgi:hypothetical protein